MPKASKQLSYIRLKDERKARLRNERKIGCQSVRGKSQQRTETREKNQGFPVQLGHGKGL